MSRVLVCQHVAYELLGTFNPLLKEVGCRIKYVNFSREPHAKPSLDGINGLVILGGPMNVDQVRDHPHLETEFALVEEALKRNIPILGICLGAQIIAHVLGARVLPSEQKEIGWYDVHLTEEGKEDPVFAGFRSPEKIFQWHGYRFEVPKDGIHLASSELCPYQAFRYGENVYGFQFHLEVDQPMIERWLKVPAHIEEMAATGGVIDPTHIAAETPQRIDRSMILSRKAFLHVIQRFGLRDRPVRLV